MTLLNWGCGTTVMPDGWVGSDVADYGQAHVGDIAAGLPWADGTFDGVLANHSLQALPWEAVAPALAELRRVTRPGGVLHVLVPNIEVGWRAYERHDRYWFPEMGGCPLSEAFSCWLTWYGTNRSTFTRAALAGQLAKGGWSVATAAQPASSPLGVQAQVYGLAVLDDRLGESLCMEAMA